jgi:hypothetical protein
MDGPLLVGGTVFTAVTDTNWAIGGTADFDSDGETDLLWRNRVTGDNVVWFMSDVTISSGAVLQAVDPEWQAVATGRFDREVSPDIVWRNQVSGGNVIWWMQGTTLTGGAVLTEVPDAHWRIVGGGDANADGNADLFWRNAATGQNVIWLLNGGGTIADVAVLRRGRHQLDDAVGDFNGDGQPDLVCGRSHW